MQKRVVPLATAAALFVWVSGAAASGAAAAAGKSATTSRTNARLANLRLGNVPASRPAATSVPVIHLRGKSAAALGESHAEQLGKTIAPLYRGYFGHYFSDSAEREACLKAAAEFERFMLPEHVDEVRAMTAGTGLTFADLMLAQSFLDLSPAMSCSTIALPAAGSADRVARFGRNVDFPSFNIADKNSVVLVFHPKNRDAFASVCWPGMTGVLSGINEHGLALANMEVARKRRPPVAMPNTMLYRMLLERCKTVDEALALLKKTPRQSANNLMMMDASGSRAVAEITPSEVTVRRAADTAVLISTNHHRGTDLDTVGRCDRFDALHEAARREFGHISELNIEQLLACVGAGKATIQSMIFEPASRILYLAVGAGAPTRGYAIIDLNPCFR